MIFDVKRFVLHVSTVVRVLDRSDSDSELEAATSGVVLRDPLADDARGIGVRAVVDGYAVSQVN